MLRFLYPPVRVSYPSLHYYKQSASKYVRLAKKADKKLLLKKLMLGLPFYGYDGYEAIVGDKYIDYLKTKNGLMKYDESAKEHYFR